MLLLLFSLYSRFRPPKLFDFYYISFRHVFPRNWADFIFGYNFMAILLELVGKSYS